MVAAVSLTFLTVFLGIFALNLIITDVYKHEQQDVQRRLQQQVRERERLSTRRSLRQQEDTGMLSELARQARDEQSLTSLWERFTHVVYQSGVKTTPLKVLSSAAIAGVLTGFPVGFLLRNYLIGILVGICGVLIPVLRIFWRRRRRLEALREQLPDALDLMSRILRAGQTIVQAMNAISEEFKDPIGAEFGYCYEQQNLGIGPDVALRDLAKRTGLIEIKIFVLGVLVHRQSGGNLTELLDKLAYMVRERFRLRREIKSLTAEGRVQAIVLLALPVGVWLFLSLLNPTYAFKLFDHPGMIVTTLVMMFLGAVWINRIVNFDF